MYPTDYQLFFFITFIAIIPLLITSITNTPYHKGKYRAHYINRL